MIKQIMESDVLVRRMLPASNLTPAQADALLIDRRGRDRGLRLAEKARMRDGRAVSKGSFVRTQRQAEGNMRASIYTLLAASYLGLVGGSALVELTRVGEILSRIREDAAAGRAANSTLVELIEEIVESIVKGRGK